MPISQPNSQEQEIFCREGEVTEVGISGHGEFTSCNLQFTLISDHADDNKDPHFFAGPWSEANDWTSNTPYTHLPQVFTAMCDFVTMAYFHKENGKRHKIHVLYYMYGGRKFVHEVSTTGQFSPIKPSYDRQISYKFIKNENCEFTHAFDGP